MLINPAWRITTIGDGDLSFSRSLVEHHDIRHLTATVYDDKDVLSQKYGSEHYDWLVRNKTKVLDGFDICSPVGSDTREIPKADVTIFQFPLRVASRSHEDFNRQGGSDNLINRILLRAFLQRSCSELLDPQGAGLCFITSKDVKPYSHWNIENTLHQTLPVYFRGYWPFDVANYPGYRVRNVERDKYVSDTRAKTFVWSLPDKSPLLEGLLIPDTQKPDHCQLCGKGPFHSRADWQQHNASRQHLQLQGYENRWQSYLNNGSY